MKKLHLFEGIFDDAENKDPYVEKGNRNSGLSIYQRSVPGRLQRIEPRSYERIGEYKYRQLRAADRDSVLVQTRIENGKKVNYYFKVTFNYETPKSYKNIEEAAKSLSEIKKPFGESYIDTSADSRQKSLILNALIGAELVGEEDPLKKKVKEDAVPVRVAGGCKWKFVGDKKFQAIAAAGFFIKELNLFSYWYAYTIMNKKSYSSVTNDEYEVIVDTYWQAQNKIRDMEEEAKAEEIDSGKDLNKIAGYSSLYDKKPLNGILCEMPTFGEEISKKEYNELVKTGDAIKYYNRYFEISWDKKNVKVFNCIKAAANDIFSGKFELKGPTGEKVSFDRQRDSIAKNILWALIGRGFVSGESTSAERFTAYYCKWSFPGKRNDRIRSAAEFFGDYFKKFFSQWCKFAIGLDSQIDINLTFLQAKADIQQNKYISSRSSRIESDISISSDRLNSFKSQIFSEDDLGEQLRRIEEIKKEMETLEGENNFEEWKKGSEKGVLDSLILKYNKEPTLGILKDLYDRTKKRMKFHDTEEHDFPERKVKAVENLLSGPQQRAACLNFIKWLSLDDELEKLNKKINHDTYMKKKIAQDEELLSQLDIQKNELNRMKNSILFDKILQFDL